MKNISRRTIACTLVVCMSLLVFSEEKPAEAEKKLREEILAAYQTKGEPGLREFFKARETQITGKFIVDFADAGVKERKEEWLLACKVMAEGKKDDKTLADVYLRLGKYFRIISNNKKAVDYLDKALSIYQKSNDPVGQGHVFWRKGIIYERIGDSPKALEMYDKALPFFKKAGDTLGQGHVYQGKGNTYKGCGENLKAIEMYDKALPFFKKAGDPIFLGEVYTNKGYTYSHLGENSKALKMYDKALLFYEKSNYSHLQGLLYLLKGDIYLIFGLKSGDFSKALKMYEKALICYEKTNKLIGLNGQGGAYMRRGDIFANTGEYNRSLEMYDKALYCFEMNKSALDQANVYIEKGEIYLRIEDYAKALEFCDRALLLYENVKTPLGQGNVFLIKGDIYLNTGNISKSREMYGKALIFLEKGEDIIDQGYVYQGKGNICLFTGENAMALVMYDKALTFFKKAEDSLGQSNVYISKGNFYSRIGCNQKALELYDKALVFFKKAGAPLGQGNALIKKGLLYSMLGNHSKGLNMLNNALTFYKKTKNSIGQGNVYLSKAEIFSKNNYKERQDGLKLYNNALKFFEKAKELFGQGEVYRNKGDIYLLNGNHKTALEMYNKALLFYKRIEDIESESYALIGKAQVLSKLGRRDEAVALFEEAISKLEKVRTQTAFSEMKGTFMEKVYEQYEETVLFMLENKFYDKAYKYAEMMRARVFLDRMGEGLVPLEKGLKPDLMEKRDNLVARLSALTKQMQETAGKDGKKLEELKRQYRKVESEFEDLLITIRLENPEYAAVKYPQPITVKDVQANVLRPGETLVSYFVSPEKLYVFIVSKDHFKVVPIKINEKEVSGLIKLYNDTLTGDNPNTFIRHCATLYEKLFKPVEEYVKEGQDIIIVPDGELAKIPFETLATGRDEKNRPTYLLEKYRLRYVQSASLLSLLRKHYRRDSPTQNFIGFGDPVYDYKNFKEGKAERGKPGSARDDEISGLFRDQYDREKGDWGRLLASGEEVRTIADLFKKKNYRSISNLRKEATEERAKAADLKDFDYLHFSCHGVLGDMFQGLVLSQIPGASEDGYFTLNEVMNCDYHAKLVVLSACRTGSGKLERGEGVTGLTRAFMYAGSPAVVASLWKVKDEATKELMIKFYENMIEKGMTKPEALRRAKLAMIERGGDYASPYYWSAFVLYGE